MQKLTELVEETAGDRHDPDLRESARQPVDGERHLAVRNPVVSRPLDDHEDLEPLGRTTGDLRLVREQHPEVTEQPDDLPSEIVPQPVAPTPADDPHVQDATTRLSGSERQDGTPRSSVSGQPDVTRRPKILRVLDDEEPAVSGGERGGRPTVVATPATRMARYGRTTGGRQDQERRGLAGGGGLGRALTGRDRSAGGSRPGKVTTLSVLVTAVVLVSAVLTVVTRPDADGPAPLALRPDVVRNWNAVALQAIRTDAAAPTVAARTLAIVHTAIYDAWSVHDDRAVGVRLGAELRRPESQRTDENKQEAISYAAYRTLVDLFPEQKAELSAELRHAGYDPANQSTDPATSVGIGNRAAAAVLDFRHHDGANQLGDLAPGAYADYTGYQPVDDPAHWQPLNLPQEDTGTPQPQQFLTPQWSRVAPFALTAPDQLRPSGPAPLGSAELQAEVDELTKLSAELDDQDKAIVDYWADGSGSATPAGHWSEFGQWVSQRDQHGIDQDVKLFFALSNAQLDASIVAWDAKVTYDNARPVTAISQQVGAGTRVESWAGPYQPARWIPADRWRPYQPATALSPPFPDYISGHSTFSAAGATILRLFTGSDLFGATATVEAGSCGVEPGVVPATDVTLTWPTFTDAAKQAGFSRLLGGIHFRSAHADGRAAGQQVGQQVWAKAMTLFNGNGVPTETV